MNYVHNNSARISGECRQVLNYPSRQVMNNFQNQYRQEFVSEEEIGIIYQRR